METFLMYFLFVVGVVFIVKGGDWFVDGAAWIADASGIPKFIVGATIVSFATTLPELLVSSMAAYQGKVAMACGNAIGSVTANIALIMALSILFMPMVIDRKKYIAKAAMMLFAIVFLAVFSIDGTLKLYECAPILIIFVLFIIENVRSAKKEVSSAEERQKVNAKIITKNIIFLILGIIGIVVGSQLLVDNGSEIARSIGISEAVISLTAIAIGTSLPELVTTLTAIIKKQPSLSVGNIIGANVIDMTLILPICALISGGSITGSEFLQTAHLDLPMAFIVGLVALLPALIAGKFRRWQGAVLLMCYAGYLALVLLIDAGKIVLF